VSGGGLDPVAILGEAAIGADGANQRIGGEANVAGPFEHPFEHGAEVAGAPGKQVKGVRVTVNARDVVEAKIGGDLIRAVPADEIGLDHLALGMVADGAPTLVAIQFRFGRGELSPRRLGALRVATGPRFQGPGAELGVYGGRKFTQ